MRAFILASLALLLAGPGVAQIAQLSERAEAKLAETADAIAATETGDVPEMLVLALIAAEENRHMDIPAIRSRLTLQVARLHLGPMPTLQRKAAELILARELGARLTPHEVVEVYATQVYFGRNCFGFRDAVGGLARRRPHQAGDGVWLALAALPKSPSRYLNDRASLKARVADIVESMRKAKLVSPEIATRLKSLPLANVDSGKGCSGR